MRGFLLAMALGAAAGGGGCGGPALANAPHPNNAAMAGGFAAAAAAITLASPTDAAKKAESNKVTPDTRPQKVREQVPASAFDALDGRGSGSGSGSGSMVAPADDGTRGAPVFVPPAAPP